MSDHRFGRYLRRVLRHLKQGVILHYDSVLRDLRGWEWPVNNAGERVPAADLPNFRLTHDFRGPCCLCACQDVEGTYTESAVFVGEDGPNFGKYMAGCASDRCGYLIAGAPAPLPILYLPRNAAGAAIIHRSARSASGIADMYASMPVNRRPVRHPDSIDKFLKLDSWGRAGLRESEFKKLFAKCTCGLVMTRRVFQDHDCAITVVPRTIIDLTSDNDVSTVIDLTDEAQ